MTRRKLLFLATLIIVFGYLFFFPPAIGKDTVFIPIWYKDFNNTPSGLQTEITKAEELQQQKRVFAFQSGKLFGYITKEGDPLFIDRSFFQTTFSDTKFVNTSNIPMNLVVRDYVGSIDFSIDVAGYPVLEENRLIVFSPMRNRISEYNGNGNRLWSREYIAPATCVEYSPEYILVGFLNGIISLLDSEGRELFQFAPTGSSSSRVVYGCTMDPNADSLILITGIEPQRIILLEKKDDTYKPVFTEILESSFRRTVNMHYSGQEQAVYFEGTDGINILSLKGRTITKISTEGRFKSIVESTLLGLAFITMETEKGSKVLVYRRRTGNSIMSFTFPHNTSTRIIENSLFFGFNEQLMRLDIQNR